MANVSPSKITNRGHCAGSILLIILLLLTLPFFHSWKESQCPCVVSQEKSGTMLPRRSPPSVDASAVEWNGIHGFRVMKVVSSSNSEETMMVQESPFHLDFILTVKIHVGLGTRLEIVLCGIKKRGWLVQQSSISGTSLLTLSWDLPWYST